MTARPRAPTDTIMRRLPASVLSLLTAWLLATPVQASDDAIVSYAKDVRPILARNCVECHDEDDPSSGLVLTSVAAMKKGGKRGAAVAPGGPEDSLMVMFMKGLREPQMPPENLLSTEEIALVEKWIKQGAKDDSTPKRLERP